MDAIRSGCDARIIKIAGTEPVTLVRDRSIWKRCVEPCLKRGRKYITNCLGTIIIGGGAGIIIGAATGYFGGWFDEALMRINDAVAAFPSVLLALVIISIAGTGKYKVMMHLDCIYPKFCTCSKRRIYADS